MPRPFPIVYALYVANGEHVVPGTGLVPRDARLPRQPSRRRRRIVARTNPAAVGAAAHILRSPHAACASECLGVGTSRPPRASWQPSPAEGPDLLPPVRGLAVPQTVDFHQPARLPLPVSLRMPRRRSRCRPACPARPGRWSRRAWWALRKRNPASPPPRVHLPSRPMDAAGDQCEMEAHDFGKVAPREHPLRLP